MPSAQAAAGRGGRPAGAPGPGRRAGSPGSRRRRAPGSWRRPGRGAPPRHRSARRLRCWEPACRPAPRRRGGSPGGDRRPGAPGQLADAEVAEVGHVDQASSASPSSSSVRAGNATRSRPTRHEAARRRAPGRGSSLRRMPRLRWRRATRGRPPPGRRHRHDRGTGQRPPGFVPARRRAVATPSRRGETQRSASNGLRTPAASRPPGRDRAPGHGRPPAAPAW